MKIHMVKILIAIITIVAIILSLYHILGNEIPVYLAQIIVRTAEYFLIISLFVTLSFYVPKIFVISFRFVFPAYFLVKNIYVIFRSLNIEPLPGILKYIIWTFICIGLLFFAVYLLSKKENNNLKLMN